MDEAILLGTAIHLHPLFSGQVVMLNCPQLPAGFQSKGPRHAPDSPPEGLVVYITPWVGVTFEVEDSEADVERLMETVVVPVFISVPTI